jgi:hypothetical protein
LLLGVVVRVMDVLRVRPVKRAGWLGLSMGKITKLSKNEFGGKKGAAGVVLKHQ